MISTLISSNVLVDCRLNWLVKIIKGKKIILKTLNLNTTLNK